MGKATSKLRKGICVGGDWSVEHRGTDLPVADKIQLSQDGITHAGKEFAGSEEGNWAIAMVVMLVRCYSPGPGSVSRPPCEYFCPSFVTLD